MVGVAATMVISTMYEKSCIDSHNARKFETCSKIQSFSNLAMHDTPCIVRSEAFGGLLDTSVLSALRASCTDVRASCSDVSEWPIRASDPTMHDTPCLNTLTLL